jgi:hypothetical protein
MVIKMLLGNEAATFSIKIFPKELYKVAASFPYYPLKHCHPEQTIPECTMEW